MLIGRIPLIHNLERIGAHISSIRFICCSFDKILTYFIDVISDEFIAQLFRACNHFQMC